MSDDIKDFETPRESAMWLFIIFGKIIDSQIIIRWVEFFLLVAHWEWSRKKKDKGMLLERKKMKEAEQRTSMCQKNALFILAGSSSGSDSCYATKTNDVKRSSVKRTKTNSM